MRAFEHRRGSKAPLSGWQIHMMRSEVVDHVKILQEFRTLMYVKMTYFMVLTKVASFGV